MRSSDVWLGYQHRSPSQIGAEVAEKIKGFACDLRTFFPTSHMLHPLTLVLAWPCIEGASLRLSSEETQPLAVLALLVIFIQRHLSTN
jgi:hypothetical protein